MSKENVYLQRQPYLKNLIKEYYKEKRGSDIDTKNITISPLFSLTNEVYKAKVHHQSLLLKIYQPTLQEFTDTQLETLIVCKLAGENIYPKILKCTQQFRIQQYVDSFVITQKSLSQDKLISIMKKLACFSSGYANIVQKYNSQKGTINKFQLTNLLIIFKSIYKAKKIQAPDLIKECKNEIQQIFHNEVIINRLLQILKETPTMLCHNDCHLGNILSSTQGEYIIDFQFSQFNYIGYDIGNFLNEWSTEYSNLFQIREEMEMQEKLKIKIIENYFSLLSKTYKCGGELQGWLYYTKLGRVLSHLFWMIIGLKQINDPRISFSMVYYIKRRKQEFLKHFNELLHLRNDF